MMESRVLVVDDEKDICDILQFNLEKAGYIVDVANSGEEALKLITDVHQLIILDVDPAGGRTSTAKAGCGRNPSPRCRSGDTAVRSRPVPSAARQTR